MSLILSSASYPLVRDQLHLTWGVEVAKSALNADLRLFKTGRTRMPGGVGPVAGWA